MACPPPFTAKGVRVDPKIRSYEYAGRQMLVCRIRLAYYLAHVLGGAWLHRTSGRLGIGGTSVFNVEQVLRRSFDHPSDGSIRNERMTRSRGKNTCEAPEIAAAI